MEACDKNHGSSKKLWSDRKKKYLALTVVVLAAVLVLTYVLHPLSQFRERRVMYDYEVMIEPEALERFVVVFPMPANRTGAAYSEVLSHMTVTGDALVSVITTTYGDGLKVVGTGAVTVEWSYNFTYRTSSPSSDTLYWNLTMLAVDVIPRDAYVHLEGVSLSLNLTYSYSHYRSSLDGSYLRYKAIGDLMYGWNSLEVDFDLAVS